MRASVFVLLLVALLSCCQLASSQDPYITAIFVIRDVTPSTNRDFERIVDGNVKNLVSGLDSDRKPIFNRAKLVLPCCPTGVTTDCSGACPTATSNAQGWIGSNPSGCSITNQALFSTWYRDTPGVNQRFDVPFNLTYVSSSKRYEYNNGDFFPINGLGFGNYYNNRNYHFTVEWHTQFTYQGGEVFDFTGDDDIWVFINNQLVVDLGGVHGATQAPSFALDAQAAAFGLVKGNDYWFDFFFAERHTTQSNFRLSTSIQLNPCPFVDACGICTRIQPPPFTQTCTKDNCIKGTCACNTGACNCLPGVTTSGTRAGIFCDQECGNSIIEGSEICDNGVSTSCCDSARNASGTCRFQPAETPCTYSGNANALCVRPVCQGGSLNCGVLRSVATEVTPAGQTPPTCQYFGCNSTGGISTYNRADNTPCPAPDACSSAVCRSGQCVVTPNTCPAPTQQCRKAGSCNANTGFVCAFPFADPGSSCSLQTPLAQCRTRGCDQNGNCVDTIVADNTDCGGTVNQGCGQRVCISGACVTRPTALVGKACSGTNFGAGACSASICQADGTCAVSPVNTGDICAAGGQCNENRCSNGQCVSVAIKAGQTCTGTGITDAQCQGYICQNGACVIDNNGKNGATCGAAATFCQTRSCFGGVCRNNNRNENQVCDGAYTDECNVKICQTGTCAIVSANDGKACGTGLKECSTSVCDSGTCSTTNAANQTQCGNHYCNTCDGLGACVKGLRECAIIGLCPAPGVCAADADICVASSVCCGNGIIETGEQCDDAKDSCCTGCVWDALDTDCSDVYPGKACYASAKCLTDGGTGRLCTPTYQPSGTNCSAELPQLNPCMDPECNNVGVCGYVGKPARNCSVAAGITEDSCNAAQCVGDATEAVCKLVGQRPGLSCTENTNPIEAACGSNKCVGQSCSFVANNVTDPCSSNSVDAECNTQQCATDGSGKCIVTQLTGPACTSLTAADPCNSPKCVAGACSLVPTAVGTDCVLPNGDCNAPKCDGAGNCVLTPARQSLNCTAVVTSDCQEPLCASDGTCAIVNKPEDTSCNRTDTPICGRALCRTGQCVNVALADPAATPCQRPQDDQRVCVNYFCDASQKCSPINLPQNASCDDGDACNTDICDGSGTCVKTQVIFCSDAPSPCQGDNGRCVDSACQYPDLPAFSVCVPSDETRNTSGACDQFQCIAGNCQPNCGQLGICGDGEVQTFAGEECDWAADGADECCDLECHYRPLGFVCNTTDDYKVVNASALNCLSPQCNGAGLCRLLPNTNLTTCRGATRSKAAMIGALVAGGTTACIAAAAGIFLWRKAQSAAEAAWLKEYLDAGSNTVVTSSAFEPSNLDRTNPAFSS